MSNAEDALLIEVALRDSRHVGVIMALDRMMLLPVNEEQLQVAMRDLELVKTFINTNLPSGLRESARAMFVEHGRLVANHYRTHLASEV
ncbi:hypothetical protein HBO23_32070 [Pseudomonas sp. WS 5532]|uniref:hypothetical protein n=1 Tax=Pseudomonas sp. WS 5532 TaxID=2717495 RepID=UPI001475B6AA|nr:hypothetical protein [Pseudomonas sp. WS 5532]NMX77605.1 hypothetical protein [Pseudomonas sp. WS 5532]